MPCYETPWVVKFPWYRGCWRRRGWRELVESPSRPSHTETGSEKPPLFKSSQFNWSSVLESQGPFSKGKKNYTNIWIICIGGSRGGVRDARPPGRPNSFDFMQFSGKFGVFTPPLEGSRPPSGKSWIRHWYVPTSRCITPPYSPYLFAWKEEIGSTRFFLL